MSIHKIIITASALVGLALLASCATNSQSSVAALEVGLTTAENAAIAYVRLPNCGTPNAAPLLCSTPEVVASLKAADLKAYSAIKSAEAAIVGGQTGNLADAQAALAAFQSVIVGLPK